MIRLLVIFDVEGWAFHNRALALAKHAPTDFHVSIAPWTDHPSTDGIDIVFQLDSAMTTRLGSMPHVLSWNSDPNRRSERWQRTYEACDFMIFNNRDCFTSHGRAPRTFCIANGVATDIFRVTSPIESRPERVFWTGSGNPRKGKGLQIIQDATPRLTELGFYVAAFPVESAATKPFTTEEMVAQYNSSGYVLCLSDSDATPNTSLEGMACGCCLVTTRCGNALEFDSPETPCVFIDRSVDSLVDGLLYAREHRVAIASEGAELMRTRWSYGAPGNRAKVFFDLFRELAAGRVPAPFSYDEDH